MKNSKKKMVAIVLSIFAIITVLGTTYAFITQVLTGNKQVIVNAGVLDLVLEEENAITISDALPMYDEVGIIQKDVFRFRLVNKTSNPTNYVLKIQDIETGTLAKSDVKYGLTKNGKNNISLLSNLEDGIIDRGTIEGNQTNNYELRLWIRDNVTEITQIQNKFLRLKMTADTTQKVVADNGCEEYVEKEPNAPQLTSGMIAVTYNETNKTWVKADTSNNNWYDYDNQIWANAVTVTKETRESYMNAQANTPISVDDINTMWVWIPRYSYTIRDTYGVQLAGGSTPSQATPGAIDIKFISTGEKDAGTGTCTKCASNWVTPVGFTFGTEEIPGFWMGKFETSTLESCSPETHDVSIRCDVLTLTPQIKPNVTSWRGARVSTFFLASRLMQSSDATLTYNAETYGFDVDGTGTMDSHVLKNTEWGIVAMLSQSKYGKYGNTNYTGANKEVYQNKSSNSITGSSNGTLGQSTTTPQFTYDAPITGYGASTTGTIYGVYDMNGGTLEYVMGNYNNISGYSNTQNSGFCGTNGPLDGTCREWPNDKYIDVYTSDIASSAYKFGDATYETFNWYGDTTKFIYSNNPWFIRGDDFNNDTNASMFNSDFNYGGSDTHSTSRLAIKP